MSNNFMITAETLRLLPKVLLHEHLDCSLRPSDILWLWEESGTDHAKWPLPAETIEPWVQARNLCRLKGPIDKARIDELDKEAADRVQAYLAALATSSLTAYINAINTVLLPIMQTAENLKLITRHRIEDAVADGIAAMELRYAPQLSTSGGLNLEQVMDAVLEGAADSPIPVAFTICALRHEDATMANRLADLAIAYKDRGVRGFDLAADESKFPGVLEWWRGPARRVANAGLVRTIHLGETGPYPDSEVEKLTADGITRIGHGIHITAEQDRGRFYFEVCPTSNVTTGEFKSLKEHSINKHLREGRKVTVNTDGLLFNHTTLTKEFMHMHENFGWGMVEFSKVLANAIEASVFASEVKAKLMDDVTNYCLSPR